MNRFFLLILSAIFALSCSTKDEKAAMGLAKRIVPEYASRIEFIQTDDTLDVFALSMKGSNLIISGNNANSMAVGLNHYLKYYCNSTVSWYIDDPVEYPSEMPYVDVPVRIESRTGERFFLNYCTFGYTMPWWKWEDWERLIDWMALNGVTMPLATAGQEAVWQKIWRRYGLSDEQIRAYFTGPAHLGWHRMSNIDGFGGPLPQGWIDGQVELQKKILERERSFNMRPVLPAFSGHIPPQMKEKFPEAQITRVKGWAGFPEENLCHFLSPTDVVAVQTTNTTVSLTWKDAASGEKGYNIYKKEAAEDSFGEPVATLDADVLSYEFKGLSLGSTYVFGVQATGQSVIEDSKIAVSEELTLRDLEKIPEIMEVKTSYAYIAVSYKVLKISGSNPEHGLCFSETGAPSVEDIKVSGPALSAAKELLQVVPNAYLEADKEYQMSVFIKDGDTYRYSRPQSVKLDVQPKEPQLDWEKQSYAGAEGVDIYKTTSQLNGRSFNAWYAVADPSKVDFRVLNTPTGKANCKTVSYQAQNAADECLVLLNGGVFGNYHIGVIHVDGEPQEWVDFVYNKYWNPNNDGTSWYITRPIIGVDKSGKAGAYWTSSPEYGTYYYYDRPLPTVPGEAAYAEASQINPVPSTDWQPFNALSTGPMLLYDGKCCVDRKKAPSGAYMTNYECWALDIYEGHPDRTAVGVTADGKIVLFICDGRIDASQGAYHEEVAMIMKSIGCVHAMNLDGGGSTGMWVNGAGMINHKDGSWRAVKSTLGFFRK